MKFTVVRKNWARGGRNTTLLNEDGKRCCLGFLAKECGYADRDTAMTGLPSSLVEETGKNFWPKSIVKKSSYNDFKMLVSDTCLNIIGANDDKNLQGSDREEKLTKLFGSIGIEVEFVDEDEEAWLADEDDADLPSDYF